jgi:colicin import membrane protein
MRTLTATISSILLMFCSTAARAETARARIADTPVRAEANLAGAVIATLAEGTRVDVIDVQGDYYRVLVPGEAGKPTVGYVLRPLVDLGDVDGSSNQAAVPPSSQTPRPAVQGAPIAPTPEQLGLRRDKVLEKKRAAEAKAAARQLAAEQKAMEREIAAERKAMEQEFAAEQKAIQQQLAAEKEAAKREQAAKAERDRLNAELEALKARRPVAGRQDR